MLAADGDDEAIDGKDVEGRATVAGLAGATCCLFLNPRNTFLSIFSTGLTCLARDDTRTEDMRGDRRA